MKILANLLSSLMIAVWLGAIAIFAIQNVQTVSLKFLGFESIQFPVSVILTFCLGGGIILGSLLPILWQRGRKVSRRSY